MPIFLS